MLAWGVSGESSQDHGQQIHEALPRQTVSYGNGDVPQHEAKQEMATRDYSQHLTGNAEV